jgi:hypothetical protein
MELQMEGSFEAKDVRGKKYTINIYRPVPDPTDLDFTRSHAISRVGSLRTSDGEHVNWLAEKSYEIMTDSGRRIRITSDDPDAP